ncbi:hypothetical protein P691DRAFT_787188 [Macrolepiota fuliginosa MF-IS2]|uniref:Uncharacterized protein n=1 Tax=Macrolepiota fuliginosa MF-IS2 TaxID=1400762 RepID=A0A9P5X799_9AGAR|nr:hypothetical protein P691DRAFT_787188 [Macrolepiota fuliginosa MF-IS2]
MVLVRRHFIEQQGGSVLKGIDTLREESNPDAAYDPSAWDAPPKCLPETCGKDVRDCWNRKYVIAADPQHWTPSITLNLFFFHMYLSGSSIRSLISRSYRELLSIFYECRGGRLATNETGCRPACRPACLMVSERPRSPFRPMTL